MHICHTAQSLVQQVTYSTMSVKIILIYAGIATSHTSQWDSHRHSLWQPKARVSPPSMLTTSGTCSYFLGKGKRLLSSFPCAYPGLYKIMVEPNACLQPKQKKVLASLIHPGNAKMRRVPGSILFWVFA